MFSWTPFPLTCVGWVPANFSKAKTTAFRAMTLYMLLNKKSIMLYGVTRPQLALGHVIPWMRTLHVACKSREHDKQNYNHNSKHVRQNPQHFHVPHTMVIKVIKAAGLIPYEEMSHGKYGEYPLQTIHKFRVYHISINISEFPQLFHKIGNWNSHAN